MSAKKSKPPKKVTREYRLQVRLKDGEKEDIGKAAAKAGQSASTWLRAVGLKEARKS